MSSEMSGEQMQARIAAARRDAEGLKDRIKRKKDELLDTSCKYHGYCEENSELPATQPIS